MSKLPVIREKDRLTRAKAERALTHGADPTEERFTKHQNKHVRVKAAKLAEEYGGLTDGP
jgi:hypothetical protein